MVDQDGDGGVSKDGGDSRGGGDAAAGYSEGDSDEETSRKVAFDVQALLRQLQGMVPLEAPANHCRLPVSESSADYLRDLAREARDRCERSAELPDFAQISRDLELLTSIMKHFEASEPGSMTDHEVCAIHPHLTSNNGIHGRYMMHDTLMGWGYHTMPDAPD